MRYSWTGELKQYLQPKSLCLERTEKLTAAPCQELNLDRESVPFGACQPSLQEDKARWADSSLLVL